MGADRAAQIVEAHQKRVFRLLASLVGRTDDLEDLAQEVFLRLFRALPLFRGEAQLSTYIYRIVVNVAQDEWARRRRPQSSSVSIDDNTVAIVDPASSAEHEIALTPLRGTFARGVTVQRSRIRVPGGLDGKAIVFSELSATRIDVLARLVRLDGTVQLERILPTNPRFVGRPSLGRLEVVRTYTVLGIEHILAGFDHLLYVLGMLILVNGWRRILATMSAFTATHSLTLTAAALGWVHVPQPPVEACIALSILFVAREIAQVHRGRPGMTTRWPWAVSFTFGLMHGFGFAGALAEVGLPQSSIPIALLFFNVGVEMGQLLFVAAVVAVIGAGCRAVQRLRLPQPIWLWRLPSYGIGALASFWLIQRISSF